MTDFLKAAAALVPSKELDLPELGMKVTARGLTARQINEVNKIATKPIKGKRGPDAFEVDNELLSAHMLALSLYVGDARLIPVGRESEVFDIPFELVQRLTRAVHEVCGLNVQGNAEGNS